MAEKGRQKRTQSLSNSKRAGDNTESGSFIYIGLSEIEGRGGGLMICEMWSCFKNVYHTMEVWKCEGRVGFSFGFVGDLSGPL